MIRELWEIVSQVADSAETVANLILISAATRWCLGWRWRTLTFRDNTPNGEMTYTIKIRVRHINTQNLTNVISARFYAGGMVSATVRSQIMAVTNPATR